MTTGWLGVLGGMGPLAGATFATRLVRLTEVARDQDHIPVLLLNDPTVPDRTQARLSGGQSPLPAMLRGLDTLVRANVDLIAIPCNTAHLWFDELQAACPRPILHIVQAVIEDLRRRGVDHGPVGVLGTPATIRSALYQDALRTAGYEPVVPDLDEIDRVVAPAIAAVKANRLDEARGPVAQAIERLRRQGVRAVVLGCTELPLAVPHATRASAGVVLTDSIDALALMAIDRLRGSPAAGRPAQAERAPQPDVLPTARR